MYVYFFTNSILFIYTNLVHLTKGPLSKRRTKRKANSKNVAVLLEEEVRVKIDLLKPMGMSISEPELNKSHFPAVIENVTPNGQAERKGVEVGMHIHYINRINCRDKTLSYVMNLIKKAKEKVDPINSNQNIMTIILAKDKPTRMQLKNEEVEFTIDLNQPLGMTIAEPLESHSQYPAEIVSLAPNGQAFKCGIEVGMHIHGKGFNRLNSLVLYCRIFLFFILYM